MKSLKELSLKTKVLFISTILLSLTLLIRLVDQLKLLTHFPGGFINDLSSYLAQLYFLDACGFHQFCSYWYNGFVAFLISPPGWYAFTYPLYTFFGDVKIATYVSLVLTLILGFLAIYFIGKKLHLKPLSSLFLFLLVFANTNAVRGFLRSGRPHELLSWVFFITLFLVILYFSSRKLSFSFFVTSFLYAAALLTYFSVAVYASILFFSLFLIKKGKEKFFVALAAGLGLLLSSFWLIPFISYVQHTFLTTFFHNQWLLSFTLESLIKQLGATLFPLGFLVVFYLSWKEAANQKSHLFFYGPFATLALLLFFRITPFLPILKNIPANHYFTLFIFLGGYLYLQLKDKQTLLHKTLAWIMLLGIIASSVMSLFFTAYYEIPNKDMEDVITFFPHMEGRYIAFDLQPKQVYTKPLAAYSAIYHGLDSASGWYPHVKEPSYFDAYNKLLASFPANDCESFVEQLETLNTREVLTHKACSFVDSCGLELKREAHGYCLYIHESA